MGWFGTKFINLLLRQSFRCCLFLPTLSTRKHLFLNNILHDIPIKEQILNKERFLRAVGFAQKIEQKNFAKKKKLQLKYSSKSHRYCVICLIPPFKPIFNDNSHPVHLYRVESNIILKL